MLANLGTVLNLSDEGFSICAPAIVSTLISVLGSLASERLLLVLLDREGCYLSDELMFEGDTDQLNGHYRPLFERGLSGGAARIALVHNHPSGSPFPSRADILFTDTMRRLGRILDLQLVDHLIVSSGAAFSIGRRCLVA